MLLRIKALFLIAALVFWRVLTAAAETSPDVTARFLAGLPVAGGSLENRTSDPAWIRHAAEFDKEWERFDTTQRAHIEEWAEEALGQNFESSQPLFYMFSGPDFLYANAFFPNAATYILCGTEPVGSIPDLETMAPRILDPALSNLRRTLESSLNWSFFITKHMKTDLKQTQLSGTLPILYVFLARSGCTVDTVAPVTLDEEGNFVEAAKKSTTGVKIEFIGKNGQKQTLYYFTTDLADWSVQTNPGFMKFCQQQGRGASLLKAASYLLHGNHFVQVRDFLLGSSNVILEDDSGIPFRFFEPSHWMVQQYGHYVGPIAMFKKFPQTDLSKAFVGSKPPPIDFSFGYQWRPSRSSLLVATPRVPPKVD